MRYIKVKEITGFSEFSNTLSFVALMPRSLAIRFVKLTSLENANFYPSHFLLPFFSIKSEFRFSEGMVLLLSETRQRVEYAFEVYLNKIHCKNLISSKEITFLTIEVVLESLLFSFALEI